MKNKFKLCFMGSPFFAVPSLKRIVSNGIDVCLVITQEPKPANRGRKIQKQPIHIEAENFGIRTIFPKSLKNEDLVELLKSLNLDLIVVVAYGHILPKTILNIPKFGCINLHASLLPRWRGAAPIHRAIMAGDDITGLSIMIMREGLDTGPILSSSKIKILETDSIVSLTNKLADEGSILLLDTILKYINGMISAIPQTQKGVTYANKINKKDQTIIWNSDAKFILKQINALSPYPGAKGKIKNEIIKIISVELVLNNEKFSCGTVISDNFVIKCKTNAIRILSLQRPGKKIMSAENALNGWPIRKGEKFEKIKLN